MVLLASLEHCCVVAGRYPIRDFDPYDLRLKLPKAVSRLAREHDPAKGGTVYIHCTAGVVRVVCVCGCV
jgi:protein-tyrosine phosphatase